MQITTTRTRKQRALISAASGTLAAMLAVQLATGDTADSAVQLTSDVSSRVRVYEVPEGPKFLAVTENSSPTNEEIVAYRRSMGLPTDEIALAEARSATDKNPELARGLGVPLTAAEADIVAYHQRLDSYVMAAQAKLIRERPDQFAGIAINHPKGGEITVWMVNPDPNEPLADLIPEGIVHVVPVKHTLQELRAYSARVSQQLSDLAWRPNGVPVNGVSIDLPSNSVELEIDPSMASEVSRLLASLGDPELRAVLREKRGFKFSSNTDAAAAGGQLLGYWYGGGLSQGDLCSDSLSCHPLR